MKQLDILEHTFDKTITCPVWLSKFEIKCLKSKSPRILSKDSHLFIRYKSINPYFYDVWICNSCGYSAMK